MASKRAEPVHAKRKAATFTYKQPRDITARLA